MNKDTRRPKSWAKPQVRLLGVIRDVAATQTPMAQNGNNKT